MDALVEERIDEQINENMDRQRQMDKYVDRLIPQSGIWCFGERDGGDRYICLISQVLDKLLYKDDVDYDYNNDGDDD